MQKHEDITKETYRAAATDIQREDGLTQIRCAQFNLERLAKANSTVALSEYFPIITTELNRAIEILTAEAYVPEVIEDAPPVSEKVQ